MKKLTRVAAFLSIGIVSLTLQSCLFNFNVTGACEGYSDILDSWYCYDDWTRSECNEYDIQEINAADWTFYAGETCWDLGY